MSRLLLFPLTFTTFLESLQQSKGKSLTAKGGRERGRVLPLLQLLRLMHERHTLLLSLFLV